MQKFLAVVFIAVFAGSSVMPVEPANAHGWHSRVKTVCANRAKNKPKWQSGHYALAQGVDGLHCSWVFNARTKRYAIAQALNNCKNRGHAKCRIVVAK